MKPPRPGTPPKRTLGPVSDLERHLPSDWWRTLFNAVYLKTDGDVVENDANTRGDIERVIAAVGLEHDDRILDLCCGQGRHSLELARVGYSRVTGLDRSRYLVRLARRRAREAGLDVRFREGDARKFALRDGPFDAVLVMGNSFGYFDREEDDLAVLSSIKRVMRTSGTLVIDITDGTWMRENFEPRSWEWIDENHFVCRERSLSTDKARLISREVVVHAEKGVIADQFYAERLYSPERLQALLTEAGFRNVRIHDRLTADSSRNGDLGMMAHRNLISAEAPTTPVVARTRNATGTIPFPEVTVLFGDPRLPDSVKRDGQFNAEDMDTVARFKKAVEGIPGYKFNYIDNHANLMKELRDRRPSFVFNLCDEGYNNEATMELHVPALLEMLSIPYSGAGPASLGLCYNKAMVSAIAEACDVPVPLETYYDPDDQAATIPSVFPALIKPCMGDSSIGITQQAVVHNVNEAIAYRAELHRILPDRPVLVQEYLTGPEYSVGVIGNPGIEFMALPVLQVDYSGLDDGLPKILGYESKWFPDSPYWNDIRYIPANIDDETQRMLVDWSTTLFQRCGCRDYARFDFRTDANGTIKLLEVNPNPGWCWDGKLNLMAGFAKIEYGEMLRMILDAASMRIIAEGNMQANGAATQVA
jgi:D-alanine-D-alanine ligase